MVNNVETSRKKTSNWEGDHLGEMTVHQSRIGEQVDYTSTTRVV